MDQPVDAGAAGPDQRPQTDPALWARALTLRERLASEPPPSAGETDTARKRLGDWRVVAALKGDDRTFEDRLRATGVSPEILQRLLGEDPAGLARRIGTPPAWAAAFDAAHRDPAYGAPATLTHEAPVHEAPVHEAPVQGTPARPGEDDRPLPRFLPLVQPLVRRARQGLRARLRSLASTHGPVPGLADALCESLPLTQLDLALHPVMVLEVNVARVEGILDGATPQERFAAYLRLLSDDAYRARFWREYPVLARHVTDTLDRWTEGRARFARHLHEDLPHLADLVPGSPRDLAVSALSFGEGDPHSGGQTVCTVEFTDGTSLMYKPRSLAVDVRFGQLLSRFNDGARMPLRTPRVLDRGDHGWAERVRPAPCASGEEVADFYWRTGATLALTHALRGVDFHYENLIAVGAQPVLVDLEALFHPDMRAGVPQADAAGQEDPAPGMLRRSVAATGLVPLRTVLDAGTENAATVDPSGISAAAGRLSMVPVPVPVDPGTDQVRLVHRRVQVGAAANQPLLPDGTPPDVAAHLPELLAGFRAGYRWLVAHRAELLAPGGPVDRFADAPVRYLPRTSSVYGKVLTESFHPDFLRDALDRERSVARLCSGWRGVPGRETAVRAEMDALLAGDIPVFHIAPGSQDLRLEGGGVLPGFLDERPLDAVRRRIASLGPDDLERQEWIIRASFATLADSAAGRAEDAGTEHGGPAVGAAAPPAPDHTARSRNAPSPAELVTEAVRIGDRLLRLAATGARGTVGWLGLRGVTAHVSELGPLGTDLYSGLSGIGLFLGHLGRVSGERRFAEFGDRVADEVARRVRAAADEWATGPADISAFGPVLGPLFLLAGEAARGEGRDRFEAVRDAVLPVVERRIAHDTAYDVLGGSAGTVLALLAAHSVDGDARTLDLARRAAHHLLAGAVPADAGTAWPHAAIPSDQPLTGFAHGASGMAVALARLHAVAPNEDYVRVALSAVAYETSTYDAAERSWPDFRPDVATRHRAAWCHGSAGIGMARAELLRLGAGPLDAESEEALVRDVRAALPPPAAEPAVRSPRFTGRGNHSLCHGDLGNLELLLLAERQKLAEPGTLATALGGVLDDASTCGWVSGSPERMEVPGLFTGLAGIGYQLLRLAHPDDVPSVLLLHIGG